ncbi:MAG: amino acid ABC transporter ATP-binding protein [Clostridia bacterium]
MSILKVENLKKSFGKVAVLKDISFTLEKGESLAIIGSSGSGKTTLLRCLNFLEQPDNIVLSVNDNIIFNTNDKSTLSEKVLRQKRLHFGLVFQSFNLFPQYTAIDNVLLAPRLSSKDKDSKFFGQKDEELKAMAFQILKEMGLEQKADLYPHQLSGGQQQRVAIARALALKPDILCFDEPTSALDPELTGEVLRVIKSLADTKTTMIIVTHEMAFARDVADKVMFMDKGVIVEYGDAEQVISNPHETRTQKFLSRHLEEV